MPRISTRDGTSPDGLPIKVFGATRQDVSSDHSRSCSHPTVPPFVFGECDASGAEAVSGGRHG